MREILFRGKCAGAGIWAEGYYMFYHGDHMIYLKTPTIDPEEGFRRFYYRVDPITVGQYTGLKDKNGVKIFEGDIVVCSQSINGNWIDEYIERGHVEMKHGAFGLHRTFMRAGGEKVDAYYRAFKDWLEDYEYEVIGNIHDNPELLEVNI